MLRSSSTFSWHSALLGAAWLLTLAAVIARPYLTNSPTLGDDLTRHTVRVALVFYLLAAMLMPWLDADGWRCSKPLGRITRLSWTLACAAYLVHLAMAFDHYHHWSHAAAVQHVQEVSGFGPGIYMSHLFTLVWCADVLYWWWRPARYAVRAPWIGRALHGLMLFIIFNATVVYETGAIRWAGGALFALLLLSAGAAWTIDRKEVVANGS